MAKPELTGVFFDEAHRRWVFSYYDKYVSAQAEVFAKARDYTNVIIVAGYAAFFGIWAGLVHDVPAWVRLAAGGLMAVSLLLFVSWELLVMHRRVASGARLGAVLKDIAYPADFEAAWDEAVAENARRDLRLARFWPLIFYPTCATGLIGGGILGFAALAQLAQLRSW